jgi:hypothetical protein
MKLKIFKYSFIQDLISDISKNIDIYQNGNFDWTLSEENGQHYFEINAPWLNEAELWALNNIVGDQVDQINEARDSSIVFNALKNLPPDVARDPRIWTTLCHTHCMQYIRRRNHKFIYSSESELASKNIKSRFFIEGVRSYERTNGLARLWWYGYIVEQTKLPFESALETQLGNTDFRANTIERPEVFSHKEIRTALIEVALNLKNTGDFFYKNKEEYRAVFRDINERATRIFFPAVSNEQLVKFVKSGIDSVREKKNKLNQSQ